MNVFTYLLFFCLALRVCLETPVRNPRFEYFSLSVTNICNLNVRISRDIGALKIRYHTTGYLYTLPFLFFESKLPPLIYPVIACSLA